MYNCSYKKKNFILLVTGVYPYPKLEPILVKYISSNGSQLSTSMHTSNYSFFTLKNGLLDKYLLRCHTSCGQEKCGAQHAGQMLLFITQEMTQDTCTYNVKCEFNKQTENNSHG